MVSTTARREAVEWLRETRKTSVRRACRVVGLSTATWRYRPRLNEANAKLVEQLHRHAAARSRFGYRRLHVLITRAGTTVNHKRLYRLYQAAGLQVRRRRRKRLTRGERVPRPVPTQRRERWSMDFTLDTLADGRAFRTLNIVDGYTRGASRSKSIDRCQDCA
jgi:putative transposase